MLLNRDPAGELVGEDQILLGFPWLALERVVDRERKGFFLGSYLRIVESESPWGHHPDLPGGFYPQIVFSHGRPSGVLTVTGREAGT